MDPDSRRLEEAQLVTDTPFLTVSIIESLLQAALLVPNMALKLRCLSTSINLLMRCNGALLKKGDEHMENLATILTSMYLKTLWEQAAGSDTMVGEKVAVSEVHKNIKESALLSCKALSGSIKDHLVLVLYSI